MLPGWSAVTLQACRVGKRDAPLQHLYVLPLLEERAEHVHDPGFVLLPCILAPVTQMLGHVLLLELPVWRHPHSKHHPVHGKVDLEAPSLKACARHAS